MSVGKYSPTVSAAYRANQNWFELNCPLVPRCPLYDVDGYDSYGYDKNDVDRAGYREEDYLAAEEIDGVFVHTLYEQVLSDWGYDAENAKPVPTTQQKSS